MKSWGRHARLTERDGRGWSAVSFFFPSRWFEAGTVWKKQARRRSRVIQSESAVVRDVLVLGGRAGSRRKMWWWFEPHKHLDSERQLSRQLREKSH